MVDHSQSSLRITNHCSICWERRKEFLLWLQQECNAGHLPSVLTTTKFRSYMPGKEHANADLFSRLPLPVQPKEIPMPVLLMEAMEFSLVTVKEIKTWAEHNPVLLTVQRFVKQGWPKSVKPEFHPYHSRKLELSIQDGCLSWGSCIIVPKLGRGQLLSLLHDGHPVISKMKGLAHSYVWWPHIDADIEAQVKRCNQCQSSHPSPPLCQCTHGNGQNSHGNAFTLTTQDHSWVRCFC